MAGRTTRFGFNKFGGGVAGTITDDGGKFTGLDRDVLDKILASYETHDHRGGGRLADPTDRPTLSLDTTTGTLPAARTLFYRVSFVDRFGLETKASPEYSVTTPYPLQPPGAPSITTGTGGAVRVGITYYALSYHQGVTETDLGAATLVTISGAITPPDTVARRSVILTLPATPVGVTGISVWRQGATESGFTRITGDTPQDPSTTTFVDDGGLPPDACPSDPTHRPSGVNLTNSTNSVTITVPHQAFVTAQPSDVKRWRIYRSGHSGVYSAKSLLAEVIQTVNSDGTGGLVPTFVDTGSVPLTTGIPLDTSQTIVPSVVLSNSALRATTLLAPSGAAWRLVCTVNGSLATTSSELAVTVGRLLLTDSAGVVWAVGISEIGQLTTGISAPSDIDTVFAYGFGPSLPTPDATLTFALGVETDGALVTFQIGTGLGGSGGGSGGGEGERGPAGPPGPPGIYAGTWDISEFYTLGETVSWADGSYVCTSTAGVIGTAPDVDPSNWQQVSAPGSGPAGPTGATGDPGPPGTYGGAWDIATTYDIGVTVSYDGSSYVSTADGVIGTTPDVDTAHWQLVAIKGDTGATGPAGPTGPAGIYVGNWDSGTQYNFAETVSYADGSWVCTNVAGSIIGTAPDADPSDWQQVSAPGSGPVGPTGPLSVYVGTTAPDPLDFPLWLDTTY